MNLKKYPLIYAREIAKLERHFDERLKVYEDLIQAKPSVSESIFYFVDKGYPSFCFHVIRVSKTSTKDKIMFDVSVVPFSEVENHRQLSLEAVGMKNLFELWIKLLLQFNEIPSNEEDLVSKFYEKEFYTEFEIVEEHADEEPFSSDQQIQINTFLVRLIENAKSIKGKYLVAEIIEQAEQLRKDLPISTKKRFVKKLSKLFGTIKKTGVDVVKELLKEGMKEGIKYVLTEGYKHLM